MYKDALDFIALPASRWWLFSLAKLFRLTSYLGKRRTLELYRQGVQGTLPPNTPPGLDVNAMKASATNRLKVGKVALWYGGNGGTWWQWFWEGRHDAASRSSLVLPWSTLYRAVVFLSFGVTFVSCHVQ